MALDFLCIYLSIKKAVKNTKFFPGQSYLPEDLVGSGSAQKVYPPARPSYQIIIPKEEPDFLDKNGISIETQYKVFLFILRVISVNIYI